MVPMMFVSVSLQRVKLMSASQRHRTTAYITDAQQGSQEHFNYFAHESTNIK